MPYDDSIPDRLRELLHIHRAERSTPAAPNNEMRADWADEALSVFISRTFYGDVHPEDRHDAIGDLIVDLLHLAKREGLDPNEVISNAVRHFEYESEHDVEG